jgi:hypothetical protein
VKPSTVFTFGDYCKRYGVPADPPPEKVTRENERMAQVEAARERQLIEEAEEAARQRRWATIRKQNAAKAIR